MKPSQGLDLSGVGAGSLASSKIVERLVRDFYGRVLMANVEEDVLAAVRWAAEIFGGHDPAYTPQPGWSGQGGGLLRAMQTRLGVSPTAFEAEALRQGFARLATEALGIVKAGGGERAVDRLIVFTLSLLLGTIDLTHPGGLDWKHGPVKGTAKAP